MEAAREILLALWACLLFGIGLIVSNMTNPARVLAFLDLTGAWDPSLGIVLGGALLAAMPAYTIARRRRRTLLGERLDLPTATRIDARLLLGSVLFGAGWGLAGYCPGPAVASSLSGAVEPLLFFCAMVAGMAVFEILESQMRESVDQGLGKRAGAPCRATHEGLLPAVQTMLTMWPDHAFSVIMPTAA